MSKIFSHLIPDVGEWPVAKINANRVDFIKRLNQYVLEQLLETHQGNVKELIAKTIYMEQHRMKMTPWKVDPPDEKTYWAELSKSLEEATKRTDRIEVEIDLLKRIINRYNEEVVGKFKTKTFLFSRYFLTAFFKRIFNRYFGKKQWRWGNKKDLQAKIHAVGDIELMRSLFDNGTVVVLPTHYSNLDSIMIGYAVDANVGVPAFAYGAGLNLYNVEIVAYFINRLGAFIVDRRKKNPIYLECLTSMTSYYVLEGVNSIFFPGGTRSRSGKTEDKLKLGLINSVIETQRLQIQSGQDKKVFIVPLNIGYHFVLEASSLIDQHLQIVGKEKYIRSRNAGPNFQSVMSILKDLFTKESEVYMSFGKPVDVFGNRVDTDGKSFDKFGNEIDIKDYFSFDGNLGRNVQREGVYAKLLGEHLVKGYREGNVVLSSNIAAFVAFHLLYAENAVEGLIPFMNVRKRSFTIDKELFREHFVKLSNIVIEKAAKGEFRISEENWSDLDQLAIDGISKMGIYHAAKPLKIEKSGKLKCEDHKVLYFYHNRLLNYQLEEAMGWTPIK